MDGIVIIIVLIYTAWAIYSGYKVVSGRSEWLDRKEPASMIVKFGLALILGYFIGAFYFFYLILKVLHIFWK